MFSSFDIYGKQISFGVAGRNSFKTSLGSFFTLLTIGLTIFCCLLFGSDLYYHENPNVVDQTSQPLVTTPLYFTPENYTMVFSFGDDYFNFDPVGYFDLTISYQYIDNFNSITTSTAMDLRRCTAYDMRNYLGLYQQGNFFCFDLATFSLNGSWTEQYLSRIEFVVNRCKNSSDSDIICLSDDEISMKVQDDVYFNIYTEDKSVNTNNFQEPFSNYIKDLYWLLDNNLGKHSEIYLKKVTIQTDSGVIFSSITSEFVHKFEHYDLDVISNRDPIDRTYPFMKLILYASSQTQLIQRVYPKIQMVAAEVSGFVKIFSMFCAFFLSMYAGYSLSLFLINSEFDNTRKAFNKSRTYLVGRSTLKMPPGTATDNHLLMSPKNPLLTIENDYKESEEKRHHTEVDYSESIEEKIKGSDFLSARPRTGEHSVEKNFEKILISNKNEEQKENLLAEDSQKLTEKENIEESEKLKEKEQATFEIIEKPRESVQIELEELKKTPNLFFSKEVLISRKDLIKDEEIPVKEVSKMKKSKFVSVPLNDDSMSIDKSQIISKSIMNKESKNVLSQIKSIKDNAKYETGKMGASMKSLDRKTTMRQKLEGQNLNRSIFSKNIEKGPAFKFTFWDYIMGKYCLGYCYRRRKQKNKKLKVFQKAQTMIASYFDARILIRKIIDIERMKKLLFTEEQLKVYEFLTKPKLHYDKEEKNTAFTINDMTPGFLNLTDKKLDEKLVGVENFYRRMKREENPCYTDQVLYNMLDEDLKDRIEEEEGLLISPSESMIRK